MAVREKGGKYRIIVGGVGGERIVSDLYECIPHFLDQDGKFFQKELTNLLVFYY